MVGTVVTRGFEGVDHNGISRELALGSLDIQTLDISSRRELPAILTASLGIALLCGRWVVGRSAISSTTLAHKVTSN